MAQKRYHWCGGRVWVDDSAAHFRSRVTPGRHRRYRRFYRDQHCRQITSSCPSCGADLYAAERAGDLRDLSGEADIGKAIRAWQKERRRRVRPGAQPPAEGVPATLVDAVLPHPDGKNKLDNVDRTCYNTRAQNCAPPTDDPTHHHEEEPIVTAPAPSAPASPPAAPTPPARTLLAQLTGQSDGGQAVKVTLEQSTSAAKTVFLTITTDGEAAPAEKFLGVQKARARARLLAIKKQLRSPRLEDFDAPAPEPAPPVASAKPTTGTGKAAPAAGTGKAAPATPTAPVRTRDQITVIKQLGRYSALMIVGPSSRYEVVKDYGLPTAEKLWDVKATRAWQPQQRAAKEKVDALYAADPSAPPAAAPPPAEPEAAPAPATAAEPAPPPRPKSKGRSKKPTTDDGPAL